MNNVFLRSRTPRVATCLAAAFLGLIVQTRDAWAVGNETTDDVGKGLVGGALVGAEIVLATEAALGVQPWWGYAIGGGLGAIGGGIGGFVLGENTDTAIPMGLLTAGLVLAVPTTIAVLSATAYSPEKDVTREKTAARLQLTRPTAVLGYSAETGLALGIPAVSVGEVFSRRERVTYALPSATEVRVPMFSVKF